ncbi:16S rRNA processing protein RimM [Paenibacillus swuensis]|uniref:Ribosome maturation factor RimM n=1 Tax=Paenibacillus swuensis TaxID=1178515 RepID=A0A172TL25_9BACL|nr:ribosome maturation factor RimM [Paenibacillus swuensis]ANE47517.1 16S rRNA processing protein RimM [Paenibacillus swuensis]
MADKLFTVGKLVNTQGIRGEVKILSQTDFPEKRFAPGSSLILEQAGTHKQLPIEIETSREHKNMYIAKLKGYDNINQVEGFKGWLVKISEKFIEALPEDEFYFHEIIGCKVITEDDEELGVVKEILTPGANDVWVVEQEDGKRVLLPVIDDVVLNVDVAAKMIRVHLMEGLL